MNIYLKILKLLLLISVFIFTSCGREDKAKKVDFSKTEFETEKISHFKEKKIRIAVGGMITPREGFAYYKQLLDYIGEKLDYHVEFVDKKDSNEHKGSKNGFISISFGVAYCDNNNVNDTWESIVDLADKALYSDKSAGKNKVCSL